MSLLIHYEMKSHAGVSKHERTMPKERVIGMLNYCEVGICTITLIRKKREYKKKEK